MADRRERNHQWYESFDEHRMRIILHDGTEVSAIYVVCDTCEGRGKHVNPAIDSQGLTASDFDEDPDLYENYFSGMYDMPCVECHGARVTPDVDPAAPEPLRKAAEQARQEHYEYQAECEAERRMGA